MSFLSDVFLTDTTTNMNADKPFTETSQTKKIEEFYWDTRHWKSKLQFMEDEIAFIDGLLDSYVFEPDTPDLFERLQDYLKRLKSTKNKMYTLAQQTLVHGNKLGGMLERKDKSCDPSFHRQHDVLKASIVGCMEDFQNLKAEIFNYAGGILKNRKLKNKKE